MMEDIIKKIKSHPKFTFADSDDELIAIIDEINPGLSQDKKFEILNNLDKLGRSGFRKGGVVTFKDVIDYFEDLCDSSQKDDDELWDEALNHFGVTTDINKFDSSEFATYYYGSGTKSTNPIPDDMMVSGRNGSRKGEDFTAGGIKTVANAFKDITTNKIPGAIGKLKEERDGSRKGSEYDLIDNIISVAEREYGDLEDLTRTQADKVCETVAGITGESVENVKAQLREMDELNGVTRKGSRKGSVSGKGSRPENLGSISSKIVSGRNRSIRMVGQYEDEYQVDSRKGSVDLYSLISDVSSEVNQEMFRSILSIYPEVHAGVTVLASGKVRLYAYPSYQRNFTSNSQIVQGSDKEITVTFPDVDYMEESLHLSYSEIVDEIYDIVINEINSINYEATIGNLVNQGLFDEPVKSQEYSGVLKESTLQADLRNGL